MKTKQLNILVKPTNDCNMNCTYCFDRKMREKLRGTRMSKSDVEHIVNLSADYAENVEFIWHGGEPTLMGKEFYEDVRTDIDVDYISIVEHVVKDGFITGAITVVNKCNIDKLVDIYMRKLFFEIILFRTRMISKNNLLYIYNNKERGLEMSEVR